MSERYINIGNKSLWTVKSGKGIPVVLLSGGPGMYNNLMPLSHLLEDVCEVVMFDPAGCGRSSYDGNGYDIEASLQDIEAIRKEYGISKWLVIGHSWGADLGFAYSLKYPDSLLGYVSISGTGIQNDRDWKKEYKYNKEAIGEPLQELKYEHNKVVHRSLINSWRDFIKQPELLKEISQLELPSLFIYAEKDIRPSWPIEQLANLIPGSAYINIKEAEHYIWLNKKQELTSVIKSFLKEGLKYMKHYKCMNEPHSCIQYR
ncbi:alpha/beta hydrolase [Evansella sp. LMS18]|uniref:alpha/beta fold hydrolase n=1 Tax=Evansella sp. LMS18 TaxID=2924033 RepID=UPI0020D1A985|nr:alpha/beta hydrolase [Evansella sp. LMS18]UTR08993.1 alpha/beta hydrolase [Evansella sp. LMS18]